MLQGSTHYYLPSSRSWCAPNMTHGGKIISILKPTKPVRILDMSCYRDTLVRQPAVTKLMQRSDTAASSQLFNFRQRREIEFLNLHTQGLQCVQAEVQIIFKVNINKRIILNFQFKPMGIKCSMATKKDPLKDDKTLSYKCRTFQSQSKKLLNSNNGYQREESINFPLCLYPFQISVIISQKKLLSCYAAMGKM